MISTRDPPCNNVARGRRLAGNRHKAPKLAWINRRALILQLRTCAASCRIQEIAVSNLNQARCAYRFDRCRRWRWWWRWRPDRSFAVQILMEAGLVALQGGTAS